MARVALSYELIQSAMQAQVVRDALDTKRDRIAQRAEGLAASEGVDADIRTESGTRPKGRPYARVLADGEQEWGSTDFDRKRILGRAAEGS